MIPQLCQFWDNLRSKMASQGLYKNSIDGIYLRLIWQQIDYQQAKEARTEMKKGKEKFDEMLHF